MIGITSHSYAQVTDVKDAKIPEILLQLILRDSNGNLLTYIETDQIYKIHSFEFNALLENKNQKEIEIKDGEKYKMIQWEGKTQKFHKKTTISQFTLWAPGEDEFQKIIIIGHNSYQTQPGDTLTVFWTVFNRVS